MNLDPFTFGDSAPAIWLADKLNEANNTKCTRSISAFLGTANRTINAIATIEDPESRITLASLFRHDIHSRLKASTSIPEYFKSRVSNILITKIVILIRDTNEMEKFKRACETNRL
jgi:hypothetical protein